MRHVRPLGIACVVIVLAVLGLLLANLAYQGLSRIDWQFLTSFPSRKPEKAGILRRLVGSMLIMLVTAATAIPLGVAAGIYLEECARKNRFTTLIEINITNLAGVPSIVYGLMALGLLVYTLKFEPQRARRRHDARVPRAADRHRRDARGAAGHPAEHARGGLRLGRRSAAGSSSTTCSLLLRRHRARRA